MGKPKAKGSGPWCPWLWIKQWSPVTPGKKKLMSIQTRIHTNGWRNITAIFFWILKRVVNCAAVEMNLFPLKWFGFLRQLSDYISYSNQFISHLLFSYPLELKTKLFFFENLFHFIFLSIDSITIKMLYNTAKKL